MSTKEFLNNSNKEENLLLDSDSEIENKKDIEKLTNLWRELKEVLINFILLCNSLIKLKKE